MNKFKVGDVVECVLNNSLNGANTKIGSKYEVVEVGRNHIKIIDDDGILYSCIHSRFKLWKEPNWLTKKEFEDEVNKLEERYENTPLEYRAPKLYTLACPLTERELYINQLKEYDWELVGSNFTQEEIDNFPNQELIKVLVKKPYKGEN